jgi:RecG-like helicase
MSSFEPGGTGSSRRPLARRVAEAQERERVAVAGRIVSVCRVRHGSGHAYRCELDDGSGTISLLFLGRMDVPGLVVGARCTIAGTVQRDALGLVVWNPWYRLEACDAEGTRREQAGERPCGGGDDGRHDPP